MPHTDTFNGNIRNKAAMGFLGIIQVNLNFPVSFRLYGSRLKNSVIKYLSKKCLMIKHPK